MASVKIKAPKKGGPRLKTPLKNGTQRLLQVIIHRCGGLLRFTEAVGLGTTSQNMVYWRRMGKIPLPLAGVIARKFGLCTEVFNYEDMSTLDGESKPWRDVVVGACDNAAQVSWVMQGVPPKPYKGP